MRMIISTSASVPFARRCSRIRAILSRMASAAPASITFAPSAVATRCLQKSARSNAGHVNNGHAAVDAVRGSDYDVVLMDIQMPGLDGVAATRQIRELAAPKCDVRIIAMTANAMEGAKTIISKPA
jgi:CheY-like chemotaxis protein